MKTKMLDIFLLTVINLILKSKYKTKIDLEWKAFSSKIRTHITKFLTRLGYSDKLIIYEYQAYRSTEKSNFFGIKLDT